MYTKHLAQCLQHSMCSINVNSSYYWMDGQRIVSEAKEQARERLWHWNISKVLTPSYSLEL